MHIHDIVADADRLSALNEKDHAEKLLNHKQIVNDLSANYLVKTNHLIPVAIVGVVILFLLLLLVGIIWSMASLLLIPAAYIYKNKYDKKKQQVLAGEYILKYGVCGTKSDYGDGEAPTVYTLGFGKLGAYKFKGDTPLYRSVNAGDQCLLVYLRNSQCIEYVYNTKIWTVSEEIADKIVQ